MSNHARDHKHGDASPAHAHAHGHGHGHDFAAANKAYFDEYAHNAEEMFANWRNMARKEVDAMRAQWPALFDKERTVVLDFACGVGTSRRLLCMCARARLMLTDRVRCWKA